MSFIAAKGGGVRILSLDGGDERCISQLIILDELMSRLEYDHGRPVRPCEYFHHITGVGASGVLAVLLGVLGMNVEDAMRHFTRICKMVFPTRDITEGSRSKKLVKAAAKILNELSLPLDTRLEGDIKLSSGCRVSICCSSVDLTTCRMLRNYPSRRASHNPTIIQAICAAWATPGMFLPVKLGSHLMQEDFVGAVGAFNNPTPDGIKEASEALGGQKMVSSILSLGAGRLGATTATSIRALERIAAETTADNMQQRFQNLGVYFRLSYEGSIQEFYGTVRERMRTIISHSHNYTSSCLVTSELDRFLDISANTRPDIDLGSLGCIRSEGLKSSDGLPLPSPFFVARPGPFDALSALLQKCTAQGPAIVALTGLSGIGKTQMSLNYAWACGDLYGHMLFIDASSVESLERGFIAGAGKVNPLCRPTNVKEALDIMARPQRGAFRKWLVILDNADDPKVDLRGFLPSSERISVLITSQNPNVANLCSGHITLGVMSKKEAIKALLSTSLGSNAAPYSKEDYYHASTVVKELGYLPLAVIQAACYIRVQQCLPDYLSRLETSRKALLGWKVSPQRTDLKYAHSVYAAFDMTVKGLSPRTLYLLGITSFFNHANFPRRIVTIAASLGFDYQPFDLLERPPGYHASVELLRQVFCPNGRWQDSEAELDHIVEELQRFSLVTPVWVDTVLTLQFHPLFHRWAYDRLSEVERPLFRDAAIRLATCSVSQDNNHLWEYLTPLSINICGAHVNDRGALADIIYHAHSPKNRSAKTSVWREIHTVVREVHGAAHIRTTRAAAQLALALRNEFELNETESLQRFVLTRTTQKLGASHPETLNASEALGETLSWAGKFKQARILQEKTLKLRRRTFGPLHRDIARILVRLGITLIGQRQYKGAIDLLNEALQMNTRLYGRAQAATVRVLDQLASCYRHLGDSDREVKLLAEAVKLRCLKDDCPAETVSAMEWLVVRYMDRREYMEAEDLCSRILEKRQKMLSGHDAASMVFAMYQKACAVDNQSRYAESMTLWQEVVQISREVYGERDEGTLVALGRVAFATLRTKGNTEAEPLLRQALRTQREALGVTNQTTLCSLYWLCRAYYNQGKYAEAETLWQESVEINRKLFGDMHESTLDDLHGLACSIQEQGRETEAEGLWREALRGRRLLFGGRSEHTLITLYGLACSLQAQSRSTESEPLWRELLGVRQETCGDRDVDTLVAISGLALAVYEQERYAESELWWRKALDGWAEMRGRDSIPSLAALHGLGSALYAQEKYDEAEVLWVEVVEVRRSTVGGQGVTMSTLLWTIPTPVDSFSEGTAIGGSDVEEDLTPTQRVTTTGVLEYANPSNLRSPEAASRNPFKGEQNERPQKRMRLVPFEAEFTSEGLNTVGCDTDTFQSLDGPPKWPHVTDSPPRLPFPGHRRRKGRKKPPKRRASSLRRRSYPKVYRVQLE